MNQAIAGNVAVERVAELAPRRVGFIIPSSNRRFEPEASAYLPAALVPHVARVRMTGPSQAAPDVLRPRILDAARCLADARCELIFLHCTALSTELGPKGERELIDAMGEAAGVAAAATGFAIRAAFSALGAKNIAVITPYDEKTTAEEVRYLAACGFRMTDVGFYDLPGTDAFCGTPPAFWLDAVVDLGRRSSGNDAILLSCANIRCLELLKLIELAAGCPVVTSNQAVLWFAARALKAEQALSQFGSLSPLGLSQTEYTN
jgi:maleate isomerase